MSVLINITWQQLLMLYKKYHLSAASLGTVEEEMILELVEGDYDPEKIEQVMSTVYGYEYYQAEDEV